MNRHSAHDLEPSPDENIPRRILRFIGSVGSRNEAKTPVEQRRKGFRRLGGAVLMAAGLTISTAFIGNAIDESPTMRHAENMEQHKLGEDLPGSVPFDPEAHVYDPEKGEFVHRHE